MVNLMIDGGPFMWAILLFGGILLATAGWFAWRAEQRVRGFLDLISRAVVAASLAALAMDLRLVLDTAAEAAPAMKGVLIMKGTAESLSPLVLGFMMVALGTFLTAIGQRRLDARRAP
jgi:hypothetical protein